MLSCPDKIMLMLLIAGYSFSLALVLACFVGSVTLNHRCQVF
jgi:hypothetical protein